MQSQSLEKLLYMYLYQVLSFHKTDIRKISFFWWWGGGGGGGEAGTTSSCYHFKG